MNDKDHRAEDKLPVTAEVGDEGGSYSDATMQAETFKGARGNRRVDPKQAAAAVGPAGVIASQGEQMRETDDIVKHATDRPDEHKKS